MKNKRGFLKIRKGIAQNLHPDLKILDDTFIPFDGYFNLDERFFYISYGCNNLEKLCFLLILNLLLKLLKNTKTIIKELSNEIFL